ncbi:Imm1 family immunity protein [Pseudomonas sp. MF4836]|uniref:Imm1 family immunity protein n=1 Tax=Pseudomonas sp. MF4836 TaxID=1960827 RepID=UPI000998B224|nr:Imm1 family immunity protein [Pseudomonas sp. MF4836]OOV97191.1 histidine kinase [Pseudomonas sp. MF4836]
MLKKIIEDEYAGNRCHPREWLNPDSAQVLSAFNRLDGKAFSSTVFFFSDETLMHIGGGAAEQYVVFIAQDIDQSLQTLLSADSPDDQQIELVAGGQSGSYPRHQCVAKERARQALAYFSDYGSADPDLAWEVEG